jgi:hypothetical protein
MRKIPRCSVGWFVGCDDTRARRARAESGPDHAARIAQQGWSFPVVGN